MRTTFIGIFLLTALFSTVSTAQVVGSVPLVRLLALPDSYNGKLITVSGVLYRSEDGALALYADPSSADSSITANAIVLLISNQSSFHITEDEIRRWQGKYVLVAAKFDSTAPQPRSYSGILKSIEMIRPYPILKSLDELKPSRRSSTAK